MDIVRHRLRSPAPRPGPAQLAPGELKFMVDCVVISDEITGGSSVGAMLRDTKVTVCALVSPYGLQDPALSDFDCIVYSTNSRHLTAEQGYQLVFFATRQLKRSGVRVYAKRIDPSMRGNTCAETQAMLDALGEEDRVAVVVPAFPDLKRSNVGGYILVDGRPLPKALSGLDMPMPEAGGSVAELFTEKFRYPSARLYLREFDQGAAHLGECIRAKARSGARAIVLDCTSQEDLDLIADALLLSGIRYLAVDPGPFTATLARKVRGTAARSEGRNRIFGLVGGSNPLIAAQVELLRLEERVPLVSVKSRSLLGGEDQRSMEIERVVGEAAVQLDRHRAAFAVSDLIGASAEQTADFNAHLKNLGHTPAECADLMSAAYGEIALRLLASRRDIGALYSTGAEYTAAVCRELRCTGFRVEGQILPLSAYGTVYGGAYDGLSYAASSASATARNTLVVSLQYLRHKLEM